jgi:hypothetical protein
MAPHVSIFHPGRPAQGSVSATQPRLGLARPKAYGPHSAVARVAVAQNLVGAGRGEGLALTRERAQGLQGLSPPVA